MLSREEAEKLVHDEPEVAALTLIKLSAEIQRLKQNNAHAPYSSTPTYAKATTKSGRSGKTKRGATLGHKGASRQAPPRIDRRVEHTIEHCPECGEPVTPCSGRSDKRTRIIEDIPEKIESEIVEHTIQRCWCSKCNKTVEPKVADALPGNQLGHRVVAFMAWLRFGVGTSLSQLTEILNSHLHFKVSSGGIIKSSHRIAQILLPWYEQIAEDVKTSGALHADETGWRVAGKTHWLWCFCSRYSTYYMIDRSRGSPALSKFFTEAIDGILITDFWAAYNAVSTGGRQMCFAHLLPDLDNTSAKDTSSKWLEFYKKLKRLLRDALRLEKNELHSTESRTSRRARLDNRLAQLIEECKLSDNSNVKRLRKRLARHAGDLFTFLDYQDVSADNNHAEREIRPAVILRKTSHGNQSETGAATSAVMMSIYRTLRKRGHDPLTEIEQALRHYTTTNTLPPLPPQTATE